MILDFEKSKIWFLIIVIIIKYHSQYLGSNSNKDEVCILINKQNYKKWKQIIIFHFTSNLIETKELNILKNQLKNCLDVCQRSGPF